MKLFSQCNRIYYFFFILKYIFNLLNDCAFNYCSRDEYDMVEKKKVLKNIYHEKKLLLYISRRIQNSIMKEKVPRMNFDILLLNVREGIEINHKANIYI